MSLIDDLKAKGFSQEEARTLLAICNFAEGATDLKTVITKPHHEAIDSLIARGFVHQVWALSTSGRDVLGLRDDQ